jgi:hypothetical protein
MDFTVMEQPVGADLSRPPAPFRRGPIYRAPVYPL